MGGELFERDTKLGKWIAKKENFDFATKIDFDGKTLNIQNSGSKLNFDGDIFKRFVRSSNKDSLGIGLSIVKRICDFYSILISYNYDEHHCFKLIFKNE